DAAGTASPLTGNGDGTFATASTFPAGAHARSVAVGDFNGDGNEDLSVANDNVSGTVAVLLSTDAPATGNLLADGSAEALGAGSTAAASPVPPGWTREQGNLTFVRYGSAGGFPSLLSSPPIGGGKAFFAGG